MVFFFQQPVPNSHGWIPDLSPAAPYGELQFIFGIDEHPSKTPASLQLEAEERLKDFDPQRDYLCWCNSGDIFSIYIVIGILASKGIKKVQALSWNKARSHEDKGRYVPVTVPILLN